MSQIHAKVEGLMPSYDIRNLWAITDEETDEAIRLRHDSDPIERNVVYNIFIQPTPQPNVAPTIQPTGQPSTGSPTESSTTTPTSLPSDFPSMPPSIAETSLSPTGQGTDPPIETDTPGSPAPSDGGVEGASPAPSAITADTSAAPTQSPSLTASPTQPLGEEVTLDVFLTNALTDDGSVSIEGTPQNLAFVALSTSNPDLDPRVAEDQSEILQRYALNTLYFATDGPNWVRGSNWTTAEPICGGDGSAAWQGVTCDDSNNVQGLLLAQNDLFGSLPSEIRALSTMGKF